MMVCATPRMPRGCGSPRQSRTGQPQSHAEVVRAYVRDHRIGAQRERRYYALQPNLADTVRAAALSKLPGGRRHPHQRRIPGRVLQQAATALANASLAVATFDELNEAVRKTIGPLRGIGELAVYDMAYRIGAHLGLEPDRATSMPGLAKARALWVLTAPRFRKASYPRRFTR